MRNMASFMVAEDKKLSWDCWHHCGMHSRSCAGYRSGPAFWKNNIFLSTIKEVVC